MAMIKSWFIYSSTLEYAGKWQLCNRPFYNNTDKYDGQMISSSFYQRIFEKKNMDRMKPYKNVFAFGILVDYSYEEAKQLVNTITNEQLMDPTNRIYVFTLTRRLFETYIQHMSINSFKRIEITNVNGNILEISVRLIRDENDNKKYVISTPNYRIVKPHIIPRDN